MIASISKVNEILRKYDLNAKKRLGQNFLIDSNVVRKIVETAGVNKNTGVIEIGPGLGSLTQYLLEKSKKVICYEIDTALSNILKETLKDYSNLEIINQDFLKVDINSIDTSSYSNVIFISNLPYYLTSEILIKLFNSRFNCSVIAMMQKEVANRIKNANGKDINDVFAISIVIIIAS